MPLVPLETSGWALGIGIGVFTFVSGCLGLVILLLNLRHGRHYHYVSLLAIIIALGDFNSVGLQVYSLLNFSKVIQRAFETAAKFFECRGSEQMPLFTTTDPVISVLFSTQLYITNAQGLLFFYWTLVLFASSWSLSPSWWRNSKIVAGTKVSCFVVPGVQLGLLHVPIIRENDIANMMVMNVLSLISIGMGSVFLALTLLHVLAVYRDARGSKVVRLSMKFDSIVEYLPRSAKREPEKGHRARSSEVEGRSDAWLIARIAVAFCMVQGIQVYMIIMQIFVIQRWAGFKDDWRQGLSAPHIDQSEQFANICSPIPGSLTGFLFFLVFGTTAKARRQIKKFFLRALCCARFKQDFRSEECLEVLDTPAWESGPPLSRFSRQSSEALLSWPEWSPSSRPRPSSPTLGITFVPPSTSRSSSTRRSSVLEAPSFDFGFKPTPESYTPISSDAAPAAAYLLPRDLQRLPLVYMRNGEMLISQSGILDRNYRRYSEPSISVNGGQTRIMGLLLAGKL